jgi:hypothetical protein
MSEKEKEANEELKKYEDFIVKEEAESFPDSDKIDSYRKNIVKYE